MTTDYNPQKGKIYEVYGFKIYGVHSLQVDEKNSNLARHIFDELNDAYELFEQSGAKSLYQLYTLSDAVNLLL